MKRGYRMIKLLGEGSFGKAYLCQDLQDNSDCVIKQILLDPLDEEEKQETLNEVIILRKLDHSNIIKFKNVFKKTKPNNSLNIVTEYADGGDLNQKLKLYKQKLTPMTEKEILLILTQICLALNHIHKKKIIHRDLKSGNVFLTKSGLVKLGDFGIAKGFKNTWEKAKTKVGTPYYLSPEIIKCKPYDAKSDIWALGVLIYEMMTFKMPFNATSLSSLSLKIIKGVYPPLPKSYSKDLIDLVRRCLNIDPKKRPGVESILRLPFIKKSIFGFLDDVQYNENLSMTIIKKYREKREMEIMKKRNMLKKKNEEMKHNKRKSCNDKEIANAQNEENAENYDNDKNKVMKFFQKRGSLSNINEKPKIEFHKKESKNNEAENENDNQKKGEEKNEPINFLKENKIKIKNIKIVDNPTKNVEASPNQNLVLPNIYKDKREKSPTQGANNLVSEHMGQKFDLNKINEDQYNQIRYLQNLSRIVKEEEKQNEDEEENDIKEGLAPINEESIQNENDSVNFNEMKENPNNKKAVEDNKEKKEELNNEYKEIDNLKNQIIKEIGNDIFKMVYKHVENSTDKTEIKFDMESLATKLSKEFGNKKYNEKKLKIAIEKLPEIFAIVIQDRLIKYNA